MAYVYQSPTELGYMRVRLTHKQNKAIFKNRKYSFLRKTEHFYNGHYYIAQHFIPVWWVVVVCLPVFVIGTFIHGLPETYRELKRAFRQKRYGRFVSDEGIVKIDDHPPEFKPIVEAWLREQK